MDKLIIKGAREHNLKNIDLELPRDKLIVISGLSGSGKSSLAFDTIFAEGQRRYVESLSSYARQFLGRMDKPDLDYIEGLSPAISIEQKTTHRNPRSTVGTVTEIYDYYRLLFARIGVPHCPKCGREIREQSVDQIIDTLQQLRPGTKIQILAPVIRVKKGEHQKILEDARKAGFARARIDGLIVALDDTIKLDKQKKHTIEIVVDRLVLGPAIRTRLAEAVETALNSADGLMMVLMEEGDGGWGIGNGEKGRGLRGGAPREGGSGKAEGFEARGETSPPDNGNLSENQQLSSQNPPSPVPPSSPHPPSPIPHPLSSPHPPSSEIFFSQKNSCPDCGISIPELQPRLFSFNNPFGACPACDGLGMRLEFDPGLLIPDRSLSFNEGGLLAYNPASVWYRSKFDALAKHFKFSLDTPFKDLPKKVMDALLYGTEEPVTFRYENSDATNRSTWKEPFPGILKELMKRWMETQSQGIKDWLEKFMSESVCEVCHGRRLKPEVLAVTVGGKNIFELSAYSVDDTLTFFEKLKLTPNESKIASEIYKEIRARLGFLKNVGLEYLTLERQAGTLSGGEAQRIRLATQIGSALVGVLYILDEPSIGLHQRDNQRLIDTLLYLRNLGNTLIVVEHDEQTLRTADYLVDLGPGAGVHGGHIVAQGTPAQVAKVRESLTGQYLAGILKMDIPEKRREGNGNVIRIKGASEHNLKNIDVEFPLGTFTCITGVSGSGKSTLLSDVLYPALFNAVNRFTHKVGAHKKIDGVQYIDKVIDIDQSPIGRTPRSNPATYVGVFTAIRDLFAGLPESKMRGYKAGRFSFNVRGGRCENCEGDGTIRIEMNFLPDVYITCDVCGGKRFNKETLEISFKGKNIADILDMTIEEAAGFFEYIPQVAVKMQTLLSVGLGYVKLGQSALTLSGGEAQRVKLALELSKRSTGRTLYILDEPTTGLHFADVRLLMTVIQRLVDQGNTVIMIEHNLDVLLQADHIIDLGPEGGAKGGNIVTVGTPEEVAKHKTSYTGKYIREMLGKR